MKRLKFEDVDNDGYDYNVFNKKKEYLGWCYYESAWKCWCYSPSDSDTNGVTTLSANCLREIADFLEKKEKEAKSK